MRIVFSPDQRLHAPELEFNRGTLGAPFERPERADLILAAVEGAGLGRVQPADRFPPSALTAVHDAGYLDFLQTAHAEWAALGRSGDALPLAWPARGLRQDRAPASLDGRLSYHAFDISTPLTAGAWPAARASAETALTGARLLADRGEGGVFSLCRPPGHHAHSDVYGGYCFLNNAAAAAQHLRERGAVRVAILDVDYHHGNGTQQIFYARPDVLYVSIHADPAAAFPYFLGYPDETGAGAGEGCNLNLPLPEGADAGAYGGALDAAIARLDAFGPDALVVSLGVDTYARDPLGSFRLTRDDLARLGERLGRLARPTLFVMEGGYAIAELGENVAAVLRGFADAARCA